MKRLLLFLCCAQLQGQALISIVPYYSTRTVHQQYEWAVAHHASLYLKEIFDSYFTEMHSEVTPLSYHQLSFLEQASLINQQRPSIIIVISCFEESSPTSSIHLYQPFFERNVSVIPPEKLAFTPYQFGYRPFFNASTVLLKTVYTMLKELNTSITLHTPCKIPLKNILPLQAPVLCLDLGLPTLETVRELLAVIASCIITALKGQQ